MITGRMIKKSYLSPQINSGGIRMIKEQNIMKENDVFFLEGGAAEGNHSARNYSA